MREDPLSLLTSKDLEELDDAHTPDRVD